MLSMFKMRLTGTRLHKFLLNTCRQSHLVIVLYIRLFLECTEVKDGMVMVILASKTSIYFSKKHIFFEKLRLAIFSDVLCLFVWNS